MSPDHLKPLNKLLVLALSQRARGIGDLIATMLRENQSFLISGTPVDAARTAKTLRIIVKEATVAAMAFEAASATNKPTEGDTDGK